MGAYFDVAATTKPNEEVINAMMPYLSGDKWMNPSSLYGNSKSIKEDIEEARRNIAKFIYAEADEIFFTSGGSESNCWAIQGFVNNRVAHGRIPAIITTKIEHKSIMECVKHQTLAATYFLDVDQYGFLSREDVEEAITSLLADGFEPQDILVSVQSANSEIGSILLNWSISDVVHQYGAVLHTDAVQAFGHIPIDVVDCGIDLLSASGHKIGCPKGIGFLYIKNGIDINPLIYGSQMDGMRGGTENVAGIIGMSKAVDLIEPYAAPDYRSRVALGRDYFIELLESIGCKLNGSKFHRLPTNINVLLPEGVSGESILYMMDCSDYMISTGSACDSHSIEPSRVLKAIGMTDEEAARSIRITFDPNIGVGKIEDFVMELDKTIRLLKAR